MDMDMDESPLSAQGLAQMPPPIGSSPSWRYRGRTSTETSMTQSGSSPYVASHPYASPSSLPPRFMVVQTPSLLDNNPRQFTIMPPSFHEFEYGEFVHRDFFNFIHPNWFTYVAQSCGDWKYEMRRQAQQVLPFLYIGPYSVMKDREFLKREGITLLLAIRSKMSALSNLVSGEKVARELGIEAAIIDVENNQELISEGFSHAIRLINDHISTPVLPHVPSTPPRKVLVFCEAGNERSASVIMAYLMVMLNLCANDAFWLVQRRRFSVCVEEPMRLILHSYESIVSAKRDVAKARYVLPWGTSHQTSRKRGLEDPATDADMHGNRDTHSFSTDAPPNTRCAPFQDK